MTTSRVRSGSRWPRSTPRVAPRSTVTTLTDGADAGEHGSPPGLLGSGSGSGWDLLCHDASPERSLARWVSCPGATETRPGGREVPRGDEPMTRSLVSLRSAVPDDAERLAELWSEVCVGATATTRRPTSGRSSSGSRPLHDERLVVAEFDGQLAGAVHLRAATMTPAQPRAGGPDHLAARVPGVPPARRRPGAHGGSGGVRRGAGVAHVATAVVAGSRDANRFMARLALGPHALLGWRRCTP